MSQNVVELVAKFKDNASTGLRRLAAEAAKTSQEQGRAVSSISRQHQQMYSAAGRLGIRTEQQIRREIQRTQAAYNSLAKSGVATQRDLARAAQATRARIRDLNAEMGNTGSRWQRMGAGIQRVGRGAMAAVGGATAGAYVLAQPVGRTMDYDTALRHAANTMYAGESIEKRRAGMDSINQSVMQASYVGGATRESSLEAMNTMAASGAMSASSVRNLLPVVMRTAAAADAGGNDIANIVTKALQAGFKESDIPSLLDRAMKSGQDGGFELKDMSRWLPQQLAAMKNAGMGATLDNFSSLLSANQMSFMTAGSADEAGNNLVNLLAKINSHDTVTKGKKIDLNGKEMDFTGEMTKRQAAGMNSLDALVDIVGKVVASDSKSAELMKQLNNAKGDDAKTAVLENQKALVDGTAVGQLVSDRQALMALLGLLGNREAAARLKDGQSKSAGAVNDSYQLISEGAGFKKAQFDSEKSKAEFDAFDGLTAKIGDAMKSLADWARGNPQSAQAATGAGYAVAAGTAAYGATRLGGQVLGGGATGAAGTSGAGAGAAGGFSLGSFFSSLLKVGKGAFGAGMLLHSDSLNVGEDDRMRAARQKYKEQQPAKTPLESPVLKESMAQLNQSAQTNQQASQQYVQAASENQAATAQMTGAAAQMTAAAAQMQAAAGKPIPVTVTVQNGNIMAFVNQAVERSARKN